jgi:endogenous inhibitor of DNA gyrase (YacG/DUF329 family)
MRRRVKCPSCRVEVEWEGNLFRPFCSERCRALDLGAWVSEHYRIPGERVASTAGAKAGLREGDHDDADDQED